MVVPQKSSEDLVTYIGRFVKGKKVLDVGCMNHSANAASDDRWLHGHVARNAASVLGLDILQADVDTLRAQGYNMVCGDATVADLGDTFEAIVAGELIEHIDDPGMFIRNMRKHLATNGTLILTTPNVFFGWHFLESIFRSPYIAWNTQHVAWYCYFTLENLFERNGLRMQTCIYFTRSRKLRGLLRFLRVRCPAILASTLVVVAQRD